MAEIRGGGQLHARRGSDVFTRFVGPSVQELLANSQWLIRLRWLAAGAIVLCAALAAGPFGYPIPLAKLSLLGMVVAGYNGLLATALHRLTHVRVGAEETAADERRRRQAQTLANAQISFDLIALASLLHLAGGINNPFALYFVFHMIIAGILLPPLHAYGQAALAAALYAAVVLSEHFGWLPETIIFPTRGQLRTFDTLAITGVMASTLFIAVYLTTTVSQKLRLREQELRAALAERERYARQVEAARQELERTQALQLKYMRKVAHELRAPLSSISMILRAIRDGRAGEIPAKAEELIRRAETRTETLLDTVDDLLTLSRLREAPLQEPFGPVAVTHLLEQVADALADIAEHRGVALMQRIAPGLPPLYGQPEGLRTALENLVGNALKYTPAGGHVEVRAELEESGRRVRIQIADTGIGIAPEDLPRIFDEFFRTETARGLQVHGSGLGLSIVKAIVEAHRGEIHVASEVGRGTTFTLLLPIANGEHGPAPSPEKEGH